MCVHKGRREYIYTEAYHQTLIALLAIEAKRLL